MIDLRLVRADPDGVKAAMARGADLTLRTWTSSSSPRGSRPTPARHQPRAQVNALSKAVGRRTGRVRPGKADQVKAESRKVGDEEEALAAHGRVGGGGGPRSCSYIPEPALGVAPDGPGDQDNPIVRVDRSGPADGYADHQRVPHWEVGAALGILDLERGVKVSGAMFPC